MESDPATETKVTSDILPPFDEMENCRRRLLIALKHEMARRPTAYGTQWVENERVALVDAANRWAAGHKQCSTVAESDVEAIEHHAMGHVDYATKLCLYVTELLYGLRVAP